VLLFRNDLVLSANPLALFRTCRWNKKKTMAHIERENARKSKKDLIKTGLPSLNIRLEKRGESVEEMSC